LPAAIIWRIILRQAPSCRAVFHQEKQVWVEVHHGLFSPQRRAGSARVFSWENLAAQSRPSRFQGMEVRRFSLELQLVYLASHLAQDFIRIGGLVALVDTIYLLKYAGPGFSWEWILSVVRELAFIQPSFGSLGLKTIHRMIDDYLVNATEFGPLLSERSVGIIWKTLMLPGQLCRSSC
jgi:Uncharacterised nucleotidyltransferase